jgi:hypothetical protein
MAIDCDEISAVRAVLQQFERINDVAVTAPLVRSATPCDAIPCCFCSCFVVLHQYVAVTAPLVRSAMQREAMKCDVTPFRVFFFLLFRCFASMTSLSWRHLYVVQCNVMPCNAM